MALRPIWVEDYFIDLVDQHDSLSDPRKPASHRMEQTQFEC